MKTALLLVFFHRGAILDESPLISKEICIFTCVTMSNLQIPDDLEVQIKLP